MHTRNASHTAAFTAHSNSPRLCKNKINHSAPRKIVHHCPNRYSGVCNECQSYCNIHRTQMLGTFGINHSRLRKLYNIAEVGIFPPTIDHGLFICSIGIRIYRLKAADFHLPIAWICVSLIPISAAVVAAPIRKLCALYFVGSSPANCKALPKY